MINYSLDINTRLKIYFIAAGISILISFILSYSQNFIPVKLITPSVIMIYGALLWLFDSFFWKIPAISGFVKIPNFSGVWTGTITREGGEVIEVSLNITQTWTRIDFITESSITISSARSVHMSIENNEHVTILFVYKVKNKTGLEGTSLDGEGVTELRFRSSKRPNRLEGPYYSSKLRKGYMSVSR